MAENSANPSTKRLKKSGSKQPIVQTQSQALPKIMLDKIGPGKPILVPE